MLLYQCLFLCLAISNQTKAGQDLKFDDKGGWFAPEASFKIMLADHISLLKKIG